MGKRQRFIPGSKASTSAAGAGRAILVACIGAVTLTALPASASPTAEPTISAPAFATGDDSILPGPVTIETVDGHRSPSDLSPDEAEALETMLAQQAESATSLPLEPVPGRFAASITPTLSVVYRRPVPTNVKAVVDAAVSDWVAALDFQAPTCVNFDWADLAAQGLPNVLGYAGSTGYVQNVDDGLLYPLALVNSLVGADFYEDGCELNITLASNYYEVEGGFYASTSPASVPLNRLDLYTTVLHELAHGLGFGGLAFANADGVFLYDPPSIFDSLVLVDGVPLIETADPSRWLTSGRLYIRIGAGQTMKLYSPSTFIGGSSYSHFDEYTSIPGTPGALMSPVLRRGESLRILDEAVLGVMAGEGWQVRAPEVPVPEEPVPEVPVPEVPVPEAPAPQAPGPEAPAPQAPDLPPCGIVIPDNPTLGSNGGEFGGEVADRASASVWRLYSAMFLRQPDRAGFDYWNGIHQSGVSLNQIAAQFVNSAEMVGRYGSLGDDDFLNRVYANTLSRCQDQAGFDYWMALLSSGELSRGEMLMYFSSSEEFKVRTGVTA